MKYPDPYPIQNKLFNDGSIPSKKEVKEWQKREDQRRKLFNAWTDKGYDCLADDDEENALINLQKAYDILIGGSGPFFIDDYDVLERLGKLHRRMGNYAAAITVLEIVDKGTNMYPTYLGDIYYEDLKDYEKALGVYSRCWGEPGAEFRLGVMSRNGYGIKKDLVNALKWFNIATEHTQSESHFRFMLENRKKLKLEMSARQIKKADELSNQELNKRKKARDDVWANVSL